MTPCNAGRSDLAGSSTSFTRNVIFSAENSYPLQLVQLQHKREISPGPYEQSTRENNLSFPHWTICAMLGGCLVFRCLCTSASGFCAYQLNPPHAECRQPVYHPAFPFLFVLAVVVYEWRQWTRATEFPQISSRPSIICRLIAFLE